MSSKFYFKKKTKLKYDFQISFCPNLSSVKTNMKNVFENIESCLSIHCMIEGHCPHHEGEIRSRAGSGLTFGWKKTHVN